MPRRSRTLDAHQRPHAHDRIRHRGLSVSFDPTEAAWVSDVVATLKHQGYTKARRSEVVRVALLVLQDALAGRTHEEILRFFIQRDLDRLAKLVSTPPRDPSG
jgi:hypothetical protein